MTWILCVDGCGLHHKEGAENPVHDRAWLDLERRRLTVALARSERLARTGTEPCPNCDDDVEGEWVEGFEHPCSSCHAVLEPRRNDHGGWTFRIMALMCPVCEGDGLGRHKPCPIPDCDHEETCSNCGGEGKIDPLPSPTEF